MADGTESLLRLENEVVDAMMSVRYALDAQEAPRAAHLDIIRTNSLAFARLAERIHKQHVKEEEDYQRREYGDG
jgi:hypothetical protein